MLLLVSNKDLFGSVERSRFECFWKSGDKILVLFLDTDFWFSPVEGKNKKAILCDKHRD